MNLFYVSCHSILEYDELKLFHGMGIDVFSHGAYVDPVDDMIDPKRPKLPELPFHADLFPLAKATPKEALAPALFEWADVTVFMGMAGWIQSNWAALRASGVGTGRKRCIWRSIGQSTPPTERALVGLRREGLELVRYSPEERVIPDYAGEDALIRFYKDPDEFGGWTGEIPRVISVGQMAKHRDHFCGLGWYEKATQGLNRMMIGPHNDDIDTMPTALLEYDALKDALRQNRAFFYTGTWPAPYTLGFIEAWIVGIPVVAIGHGLRDHYVHDGYYEIPYLIQDGLTGYFSDDIATLHRRTRDLLNDYGLAQRIGQAGREAAIGEFGKEVCGKAWGELLGA